MFEEIGAPTTKIYKNKTQLKSNKHNSNNNNNIYGQMPKKFNIQKETQLI